MRGPIDFIIIGFEGNNFDGSILKALSSALDKGIIGMVTKTPNGTVKIVDAADPNNIYISEFASKYKVSGGPLVQADLDEVAEVLENDTSAALLAIEHLWAVPLKKAILDTGGVLVAEGRIHPDAALELSK
jgi:acylphosphatase